MRLQKYLVACGVASRRGAEAIIAQGRVFVNGSRVTEMGVQVDEELDEITLDGEPLKLENKKVYIMLNKPAGFVTTVSDDRGRRTVMELVSEINERIYPVGRLDYNSEGLLIMTNDGELANKLMHPRGSVEKNYLVGVSGNVTMDLISAFRRGVEIDGYTTKPAEVEVVGATRYGTKMKVTIREGKNRQIRKMFEAQGCTVKRLKRTGEAGLSLGHLPEGKWRRLSEQEINALKNHANGITRAQKNKRYFESMKNRRRGRK